MNSQETVSLRGSGVGTTQEDSQYWRGTFERDSGEGKYRRYNTCKGGNRQDADNLMFQTWVNEILDVSLQRQFVTRDLFCFTLYLMLILSCVRYWCCNSDEEILKVAGGT